MIVDVERTRVRTFDGPRVRPLIGAVAIVAVVVTGVCTSVGFGSPSASDQRHSGWVAVDRHGFMGQAVARSSSLQRVVIRWTSGVSIKLRPAGRARLYLDYMVVGDPRQPAAFGNLYVPAHASSGRFALRYRAPGRGLPAVRIGGRLRTGPRPSLVLYGFPPGTSRVEFGTAGVGKTSTGATGPCRHHALRYRGSMRITLVSQAHAPGQASGGLACGTGLPEEPSH